MPTYRIYLTVLLLWVASHTASAAELRDLYRSVKNSVVVVRTTEAVVQGTDRRQTVDLRNQGSGVLISRSGQVLTAAHLVQTADRITIEFASGEKTGARVVSAEPAADVALLQLDLVPSGIAPIRLGNSDKMEVGDPVFIVGAPYGLSYTISAGIISARHQPRTTFAKFELAELFQTDAAVNQGNSGGPMFNMEGEVIGVVSHILSRSGAFEGLGFAVTSNLARTLLLEERSVWSGMEGYWLQGEVAAALNVPQKRALLVQRIAAKSPASRLRLQAGTAPARIGDEEFMLGGDVILGVQGISFAEPEGYDQVRTVVAGMKKGETLRVTILRAGRRMELTSPIDW